MGETTWPVLKSCKQQCLETTGDAVNNDLLIELPHDILVSIMSSLTMKEAARTSVLSHCWKYIWLNLPVLIFQADSFARQDQQLLSRETSGYKRWVDGVLEAHRSPTIDEFRLNFLCKTCSPGFTRWVNSVVEAHRGPTIDEFRVVFDLDVSCESDIDKWLVFALTKHVKRLELNFAPLLDRRFSLIDCYTWPLECRMSYLSLHRNLASLTSLCLKYVNVSEQDIECVLVCCPALEDLCIVGGSIYLTEIKLPHTSLQLKKLMISCCPRMMCIDILAPKLVSFTFHGRPVKSRIRGASLLSEVSIGNGDYRGEVVAYAYNSLSSYFPQLEYLSWDLLCNTSVARHHKLNLGIDKPPTMTKLKHLVLRVRARCDDSLLGWASLIEASPNLQKLTVRYTETNGGSPNRNIVKRNGCPLMSLKTLVHIGSLGLPIENEFVSYVVENSIMLKIVVFSIALLSRPPMIRRYSRDRILEFKRTLPKGVTFKYGKDLFHSRRSNINYLDL